MKRLKFSHSGKIIQQRGWTRELVFLWVNLPLLTLAIGQQELLQL